MEKYSKYNDPFTGINPFIQPKLKSVSILKCIIYFPVYLLSFIHPIFLKFFFDIKQEFKIDHNIRTMICNSSSEFDTKLLRWIFGIKNFYFLRDDGMYDLKFSLVKKIKKPCCIFVEGTPTNNKSILKFKCNMKIDSVCCIKYSDVYCYGNYMKYIMTLLSNTNKVHITYKKTEFAEDLIKISGLKQVNFNYQDKEKFYKLIK